MRPDRKFSRFVMGSLMLFMGISFILISIGIYFYRSNLLERNYNSILDISQKGWSDTLTEQLNYVGEYLDHLVIKNSIKNSLKNNDTVYLAELIKDRHAYEIKGTMVIYGDRNKRFINDLSGELAGIKPLLEKLSMEGKQSSPFQKAGNNLFVSVFSAPIMDGDVRLGTGYILYDISKDRHFWKTARSARLTLSRILINDRGANLYDIEKGEVIPVPDKERIRLNTNPYDPPFSIRENEVLLPLMGFPDIFYAAELSPVIEQKNNLKIALFYMCFSILVLTLAVSFFISRSVSRPLEVMAKEAMSIAGNPTNVLMQEDKNGYFEFRSLAEAFNKVLLSLFAAQEELKSEARKELEASEERYRLTVEAAPDGIVIVKLKDGIILQANSTFLRLTGYGSDEVIGKTNLELSLYSDSSDRRPVYKTLMEKGEINNLEIRYKLKNGKTMDCRMSARRVKFHGELCAIAVISDNSEQKKAEEEKKRLEGALQRASKMEAIGTMAGGVAHDLNNILSGIVGYPELLLMDLPEDSRLKKPLLTIQKSGEKAAAIVQDMLTLARRGVPVTDVVNLNNIILEQLRSPEHEKIMSYYSGVNVSVDLEPNLLNIIGSEVHLSKTIMNLISNAVEATPCGGNVNISTENQYIDSNIKGYENVREGDYVVLTVSDNGTGILPEDQEKIFEPFYTKKKMGRSGTGLGMAVVWGAVKDHDGYIDLQSNIGKGSTFKLYFPVTGKELIKQESELMIEKYMGRGESVLVVDDISEQREIASGMLTKLGYSVATASSGEGAVEYMKQNSADILVLDMIMAPGIDGLEAYKRILEIHPGQKAVVASGFSESEKVGEAQRLGAGAYVKKPYLMKNIGLAIRKELDK